MQTALAFGLLGLRGSLGREDFRDQGQVQGHLRAAADVAFRLYAAAVGLGHRFCDGQPQARFRPLNHAGVQADPTSRRAVLGGVVHQYERGLLYAFLVHVRLAGAGDVGIKAGASLSGEDAGAVRYIFQQALHRTLFLLQRNGGVGSGEEQEVFDHPGRPVGLAYYLLEESSVGPVAVEGESHLGVALEEGQRGAQLVGDVGEELRPGLRGFGEFLGGALLAGVEPPQLARRVEPVRAYCRVPPEFGALVAACLSEDLSQRPSVSEAMESLNTLAR